MQELFKIKTRLQEIESFDKNEIIEKIRQNKFKKEENLCDIYLQNIYVKEGKTLTHVLLVYKINDASQLNSAGKQSWTLNQNSTLALNSLAVFRENLWIDKVQDSQHKILDENSQNGDFSANKIVNLLVHDLHIGDYLIIESTITTLYEEDNLRFSYMKALEFLPNSAWFYALYKIIYHNESEKNLLVKKSYFRENKEILPEEIFTLFPKEKYVLLYENYQAEEAKETEIAPFIEIATQASYEELSTYLAEKYKLIDDEKLEDYAPDFIEKLEKIPKLENKISFAIEFVQDSIYYIYDADEMDGYLPQKCSKTYKMKQGDCKAKALLLKNILQYLEIKSDIILVNYRADFFLSTYLPSLLNFNHAINLLYFQGKEYFIDVTRNDEKGLLQYRANAHPLYYLAVKKDANLASSKSFVEENFELERFITCSVKDGRGYFTMKEINRKAAANSLRTYFKNNSSSKILEYFLSNIHYFMRLSGNFQANKIEDFFINSSVKILSDDFDKNEFTFELKTEILNPFQYKNDNRYVNYWDHTIIDNKIFDFNHEDFPYLLNHFAMKVEIILESDEFIDTKEYYSNQELLIEQPYFFYESKKEIYDHGGKLSIKSIPYSNQMLVKEDLEEYKKAIMEVAESNFGLGIDIIKAPFFKKLKERFF